MSEIDLKNLNVVFAGCARDCERYIPKVFENLKSYSSLFKDSYKIIVENGSKDKTKEISNINNLLKERIDKVGTKLAHLIDYLEKTDEHCIIFSQWHDLLETVGKILNENNIKNNRDHLNSLKNKNSSEWREYATQCMAEIMDNKTK